MAWVELEVEVSVECFEVDEGWRYHGMGGVGLRGGLGWVD